MESVGNGASMRKCVSVAVLDKGTKNRISYHLKNNAYYFFGLAS